MLLLHLGRARGHDQELVERIGELVLPRFLEGGGDPRWYDVYRRILAAGKSVQAIGVTVPQLKPLLDAVGPKGMYVMMWPRTMAEAEQALAIASAYR